MESLSPEQRSDIKHRPVASRSVGAEVCTSSAGSWLLSAPSVHKGPALVGRGH